MLTVNYARHCDVTCSFCAREWWAWLRSREAQMRRPERDGEPAFADAAATSVRAPRP